MKELTQKALRKALHYAPDTGIFTWRNPASNRVRAGDVAGYLDKINGYWVIMVFGKNYKAHRLAWLYEHGKWPEPQVDHINGARDDNRIANLREATNVEQHQNRTLHPSNTSGFPGVTWNKRNQKWIAYIYYRYKQHHLGYFDDVEEAAAAYRDAKKRLHKFNPKVRDLEPREAA